MESQYLIDTNVVIDFIAGKLPPAGMSFLEDVINFGPCLSIISSIELLTAPVGKELTDGILKDFISLSTVYPLDDVVVDETIRLRRKYKIKIPDAIIAATALRHNAVLLTRNVKDFKMIEGLLIKNPSDDQTNL